jgi:hypothetical protein
MVTQSEEQSSSVEKLSKEAKSYGTAGTVGSLVSIGAAVGLSLAAPGVGTLLGVAAAAGAAWFLKEKLDRERAVIQLKSEGQQVLVPTAWDENDQDRPVGPSSVA